MATLDHAIALPQTARATATQARRFVLLFPALAISWFLGVSAFFWLAVAFAMVLGFTLRRDVVFPPRFGIWLLFLAWVPLSALQLQEGGDALVFLQRYFGVIAATIVFLYVFNSSRARLPDSTVVNALAVYWAILVVGGFVAMVFATVSYHSPAEQVLPGSLLANPYVHGTVHVRFADVQAFLGFPVGRPQMFFGATNAWGAMVALLTPFALAAVRQARTVARRRVLQALLVLSIVPIVVSLNRGMWLALGISFAYVAVRFALQLNMRALAGFVGVVAASGALLVTTPLGGLISERLEHGHSNESREALYREALAGTKESPLIGYGGPRPSVESPKGPPVGTHSHVFFLLFSHGIPAFVLFMGWLALTLLRSLRETSGPAFWAHVSVLVFLIESPYYLLEAHLLVVMIAAALVWRTVASPSGHARVAT
ncbi:MAG: O-antigen ligase family protein, partial [Actinomycetota bacterium]|nr:O-antigen ligase family protein [Actinomycetota bacterium]